MSGLPGQSLATFEKTVDAVIALAPEHISCYSLIVEEGTPFYEMNLDLPDEDTEREMYHLTKRKLEEAAFRLGGQNYHAPAQLVGDFLKQKKSQKLLNERKMSIKKLNTLKL